MEERNFECDVLVIGTGASGMATAVTAASQGLKVLVVDKEARYGGTTARSGGWLWIPGTHLATEQGITEPAGAARTYLQHEATSHFDAARVDAFLANGPKAVDFFTHKTAVQFDMPPVFDSAGNLVLGITAMGPEATFDNEWNGKVAAPLRACALEVSRRLGYLEAA